MVSNRPKVAAYRAPGSPLGNFGVESVLDVLAQRIGMDPLELRLKNVARKGTALLAGGKRVFAGSATAFYPALCVGASGGILALACALLHEPQVLYLDEPTANLDIHSAEVVHRILRERVRAGATIVLTTHDMDEVEKICDRVGIMARGKLVALDSPLALKQRHTERKVDVIRDRATLARASSRLLSSHESPPISSTSTWASFTAVTKCTVAPAVTASSTARRAANCDVSVSVTPTTMLFMRSSS